MVNTKQAIFPEKILVAIVMRIYRNDN